MKCKPHTFVGQRFTTNSLTCRFICCLCCACFVSIVLCLLSLFPTTVTTDYSFSGNTVVVYLQRQRFACYIHLTFFCQYYIHTIHTFDIFCQYCLCLLASPVFLQRQRFACCIVLCVSVFDNFIEVEFFVAVVYFGLFFELMLYHRYLTYHAYTIRIHTPYT